MTDTDREPEVLRGFSPRQLWRVIMGLSARKGFAWCGDRFLAERVGGSPENVAHTLRWFRRLGMVSIDELGAERRIYPVELSGVSKAMLRGGEEVMPEKEGPVKPRSRFWDHGGD